MYLKHLLQNSGSTSNGLNADKSSESKKNHSINVERSVLVWSDVWMESTAEFKHLMKTRMDIHVNGKGFYSINVQGICNHEGQ